MLEHAIISSTSRNTVMSYSSSSQTTMGSAIQSTGNVMTQPNSFDHQEYNSPSPTSSDSVYGNTSTSSYLQPSTNAFASREYLVSITGGGIQSKSSKEAPNTGQTSTGKTVQENSLTNEQPSGAPLQLCRSNIPGTNLYEPRLRTGQDRHIPGSQQMPPVLNFVNTSLRGEPVNLINVLTDKELSQAPLIMDLINPAKVTMDADTKKTLCSPNGGILTFNAIRVSKADNDAIYALRILDTQTSDYQKSAGGVNAYWAPQGGYVDIPAHPQKGEPELVLTPAFSGCSFVADKFNEKVIRVRHVQGGKEDAEYNNLDVSEHGLGMIGAMEYHDYGFHKNEEQTVVENITGSAFMKYENGKWKIKFQSLPNAPKIQSLKQETTGLFEKKQQLKIQTIYNPKEKVANVGSIVFDPAPSH
ncbi:hypothetical protein E5C26_20110 [Serratia proteamaculans]|uniref:hypothetical protein n=1 Tax=Serratia proteamaculans TaxID=28151 RepID=UPI0010763FBC|nr:hypothetical protein [Serratia proteamaculans]TFZ49376.1 hypothetical protein E5C26_20110 [Serratia proteamaculans]